MAAASAPNIYTRRYRFPRRLIISCTRCAAAYSNNIIALSKRYQTLDATVPPPVSNLRRGTPPPPPPPPRDLLLPVCIDKLDRRRSFKKQTTAAAHPLLTRGSPSLRGLPRYPGEGVFFFSNAQTYTYIVLCIKRVTALYALLQQAHENWMKKNSRATGLMDVLARAPPQTDNADMANETNGPRAYYTHIPTRPCIATAVVFRVR